MYPLKKWWLEDNSSRLGVTCYFLRADKSTWVFPDIDGAGQTAMQHHVSGDDHVHLGRVAGRHGGIWSRTTGEALSPSEKNDLFKIGSSMISVWWFMIISDTENIFIIH